MAAITVWEILNGIGQLDPGQRRAHLVERFQLLLDGLFEDRIFDWSVADAQADTGLRTDDRQYPGHYQPRDPLLCFNILGAVAYGLIGCLGSELRPRGAQVVPCLEHRLDHGLTVCFESIVFR